MLLRSGSNDSAKASNRYAVEFDAPPDVRLPFVSDPELLGVVADSRRPLKYNLDRMRNESNDNKNKINT